MAQRPEVYRPAGHQAAKQRQRLAYEDTPDRRDDRNFYSSTAWRKFRLGFLSDHPLCVACEKSGDVTAAVHVHHKTPRKTLVALRGPQAAFDASECEGLCLPCHSREEATRRGGVGGTS